MSHVIFVVEFKLPFNEIYSFDPFSPFLADDHILCPLKTREKQRFYGNSRGCKKETLATNGLRSMFQLYRKQSVDLQWFLCERIIGSTLKLCSKSDFGNIVSFFFAFEKFIEMFL